LSFAPTESLGTIDACNKITASESQPSAANACVPACSRVR